MRYKLFVTPDWFSNENQCFPAREISDETWGKPFKVFDNLERALSSMSDWYMDHNHCKVVDSKTNTVYYGK